MTANRRSSPCVETAKADLRHRGFTADAHGRCSERRRKAPDGRRLRFATRTCQRSPRLSAPDRDWIQVGLESLARLTRRTRAGRLRSISTSPARSRTAAIAAMDLTLWVQRATAELAATGETVRPRRRVANAPLTSQETRVALLVARGLTNREVAAALFLSPKTVERHLSSVYRKRGLRSRTELARDMAGAPDA